MKQYTTDELLELGMALYADKTTMEKRIRGLFENRKTSIRLMLVLAIMMVSVMAICFTTACLPGVEQTGVAGSREKQETAEEAVKTDQADGVSLEKQPVQENDKTDEQTEDASILFRLALDELNFEGVKSSQLEGGKATVDMEDGNTFVFNIVLDDQGNNVTSDPEKAILGAAEIASSLYGKEIDGKTLYISEQDAVIGRKPSYLVCFDSTEDTSTLSISVDAENGSLLMLSVNDPNGLGIVNPRGDIHVVEDLTDEDLEAIDAYSMTVAMEMVNSIFNTGKIIPADEEDWAGTSHTDAIQMDNWGHPVYLTDVYLKMDDGPCYYVQVGTASEQCGMTPVIRMIGCSYTGWEDCMNQVFLNRIDSDAVEEVKKRVVAEALRMYEEEPEFEPGYSGNADVYSDLFLFKVCENVNIVDLGFIEVSWMDIKSAKEFISRAKPGNVAEIHSSADYNEGTFFGLYIGDGKVLYADKTTHTIVMANVSDLYKTHGDWNILDILFG